MAANLADPETTLNIYQGILAEDFRWLLLTYSKNVYDKLSFCSHGSQGLAEFKKAIINPDEVYIGFYRLDIRGKPGYVLVNYVPQEVTGVQRARALVHSRRLGTLFIVRQTTLTIDSLANLTEHSLIQALSSSENPLTIEVAPNTSQSSTMSSKGLPGSPYSSHSSTESFRAPDSPLMKTAAKFSKFLRKKKFSGETVDSPPPPPPPKDIYALQQSHARFMSTQALTGAEYPAGPRAGLRRHRGNSFSEFAVLYQEPDSDESEAEAPHFPVQSRPGPSVAPRSLVAPLTLPSKWARNQSKSMFMDPAERERRRISEQKRKEEERERARREQEERELRLQRKREEALQEEREEEERRRASLEEDLRRAAVVRQQKEELERIAEERRQWVLEEKRRQERERRLEEHRRLEEWRRMQVQLAEDTARREKEARARDEEEKKARIKEVETKVKEGVQADAEVTGWVSIQMNDSLAWKRRYYRFTQGHVSFFRGPKDAPEQVLDKILLRSRVSGLREWDQGYDELEAIPHSFAVEFFDDRSPWSLFADTEEEKFKLMGLFHFAAGLTNES
ncbi:hypothetical protein HGRIS_004695 [Hohenbuehelia grisea]|uniref:ADF-H domain-containing protein n=1 Tax=Hohenbuehelia grisea TaxID=104357 RepID=A0ABR3JCP2_9AGAR